MHQDTLWCCGDIVISMLLSSKIFIVVLFCNWYVQRTERMNTIIKAVANRTTYKTTFLSALVCNASCRALYNQTLFSGHWIISTATLETGNLCDCCIESTYLLAIKYICSRLNLDTDSNERFILQVWTMIHMGGMIPKSMNHVSRYNYTYFVRFKSVKL